MTKSLGYNYELPGIEYTFSSSFFPLLLDKRGGKCRRNCYKIKGTTKKRVNQMNIWLDSGSNKDLSQYHTVIPTFWWVGGPFCNFPSLGLSLFCIFHHVNEICVSHWRKKKSYSYKEFMMASE